MRYSIFVAIVLILMSGFVAYFGDLLGRRMGKKRLTVFGLRPRYTAIIFTTITGMVIAGLALITLISANAPFQRLVREGDTILDRNTALTMANAGLDNRNKGLIARSQELEREVEKRKKEVELARKDVQSALKTRDAAVKARNEAVKARDEAVRSIARLEKDIAARQIELAELRKTNQIAKADLKMRTSQLSAVQTQLAGAQSNLKTAQQNLLEAGDRLLIAKGDLEATETRLAKAQEDLKQQEADLQEQRNTLLQQYQLSMDFMKQTSDLRSSQLILRQGEELVRGVVSSDVTAFGVGGELLSLLKEASIKAEALGAKKGSNGRAVRLIFRQVGEHNQTVLFDNENGEPAFIDLAVKAIMEKPQEALIQIVCARNSIVGEQVPVEFRLYLNNRVLRNGRLIASIKLDGSLSEGRILLAVIDFLRKDVSEAALRAGIIPIANPDPRENLGKDPASQVDALMALVDEIKATNGRAKVEVYANEDIFAAGPLSMENMRFKVAKLE